MSGKLPQIHLIYNRYKKASSTRKAVVEIRILHNCQQKYISTGVWLYPNQWKNGKITNCDNLTEISQTLERQLNDVRKAIHMMMQEGNLDIRLIPEVIERMYSHNTTFIEFCIQRANIRKYGKGSDSIKRYDRFIRHFTLWGKILHFNDVKDVNIILYDEFLTKTGMKPYSRWNNYHRFLNGFILDAIAEGLIQRNPYRWLPISRCKASSGINKCLTRKEFDRLRNTQMPTPYLERVKDLFIFQTYTCLRYSDLARFDSNNITLINDMKVYRCTQKKTGKNATIPIPKPAMDILERYSGILPIISNVKYNEYLKVVAHIANISKPISTHWARHTGATLLLNEGVPMQVVAKICGHSSTRITEQIYAKLLDETVVDAIQGISEKLE